MNILEAFEKMKDGKLCFYTNRSGNKWICCLTKLPQTNFPKELPQFILSASLKGGSWIKNYNLGADEILCEWYEFEDKTQDCVN